MHVWQAIVLGIVEGITEFLPVSSTGHLLLLQRVLGLGGAAHDAFAIVVQLGALLAAVLYYRPIWWLLGQGLCKKQRESWVWTRNLALAALPILVLGGLFGSLAKQYLYQPRWIVLALALGGGLMIWVDCGWKNKKSSISVEEQDHSWKLPLFSWKQAMLVGVFQTLALWPGMSRSASCLIGGRLAGLTRRQSIDMAFLLAVPTLGAATFYEIIHHRVELLTLGLFPITVGLLVSFGVGWLAIAGLLRIFGKAGLWPFGLYRLVLAVLMGIGTFW